MTEPLHPLLTRLLRREGASAETPPSPEQWRRLLELVSRTYKDADQDRYTIERAMDVSSTEMQGLYQELERRSRVELETVRQSNDYHRVLFASNPLPMWVIDVETLRFVEVNDAMVRSHGYTREELLAMPMTGIKLPEDVDEMVTAVRGRLSDGITHLGLRRQRRKDGRILELDITVHALALNGRRCVLGIALDMTQARRVEEELRQAQKMDAIGRLAGGVAHDFNNILGVVLGNAEFAIERVGDTHPAAADLLEIKSAATHAARLTHQLLTFSRKQPRTSQPVALNSIVTGVETMLARIVGEDIAIASALAPSVGVIEADPGEVEQVIMNLVVNARDAMPGGGRLSLATTNRTLDAADAERLGVPVGRYVVLVVSDTGCGMSDEVRTRMFEPFFTTKAVDRGTGLGLATVFGIVQQSRGAIHVRSAPGEGTTFEIYWPRIDAPATVASRESFIPHRGSGVVLVVEDDPQLRRVLQRYLKNWGYELLVASNGVDALEVLRAHAGPIGILLTDLVMPGMDGRALSRRVLDERPDTRVVFMSGYTEHPALTNASIGPSDHFVQKPFTARTLNTALYRACIGAPAQR